MPAPTRRHAGIALTEFVVIALPLLFLGFAILEASRWYVARQAVTYALFEAVRAGTVAGANRDVMQTALERGLIPLLGDGTTDLASGQRQVRHRLATRAQRWRLAPLKFDMVSPVGADFDDFADASLAAEQYLSKRIINNDYQQEHSAQWARRYPQGIGPRSGRSLFGANTLAVRISYLHEPVLPGIRTVISGLASATGPTTNDYVDLARHRGLVAIVRQIAMPMQSHPIENEMDSRLKANAPGR